MYKKNKSLKENAKLQYDNIIIVNSIDKVCRAHATRARTKDITARQRLRRLCNEKGVHYYNYVICDSVNILYK